MARYSDDELYRMHLKGQISDDEYMAGIEANCKHVVEIEERDHQWIEWCSKCGMKVDSGYIGSGSSQTVKVKGGCIVIAFLIIGGLLVGLYGFAQLVT